MRGFSMLIKSYTAWLTLFVVTVGSAILLAWPSLGYPWYWDDFHLIRVYSWSELWQAFQGSWDVDNVETRSYRPFTTLLNHLRAYAFGEDVVAHRLFGIIMFAAFVSSACYLAIRLGLGLPYAVAAAVLMVASTSNTANLIFISDTVHAVSGLFVIAAAFAACGPVFGWRQRIATAALGFASLLVREDIAALFPFVVFVAFFAENPRCLPVTHRLGHNLDSRPGIAIRRAVEVIAILGIACVVYAILRVVLVPGSPGDLRIDGMLNHLFWAVAPAGMPPLLPKPIFYAAFLFVALTVGIALSLGSNKSGRLLGISLVLALIMGCTPGLIIERINVLLIPTTMFALLLALCMQIIAGYFSRPAVSIAAATFLFGLWFGLTACAFLQSRTAQEANHPFSLEIVRATHDMIYGDSHQKGARLPEPRFASAVAYLGRFGIDSADNFEADYAMLERRADADGRFRPDGENLFLPVSRSVAFLPRNYPALTGALRARLHDLITGRSSAGPQVSSR